MARFNLNAPWERYYHQIKAIFGDDKEIHIVFDDTNSELLLYVDNDLKAAALEKLLPAEKSWGNVSVITKIIPANKDTGLKLVVTEPMHPVDLFESAFLNNPHFSDCIHIDTIFSNGLTYVVFKNEVIQYYTDNLGDINGMTSTLMQDLAKEVFETPEGVFYCTDAPGNKMGKSVLDEFIGF